MMNRPFWILAFHLCPTHRVTLKTENEEHIQGGVEFSGHHLAQCLAGVFGISSERLNILSDPRENPAVLSVVEVDVDAHSGTEHSVLGHTSPAIILA